MPSSAQPAILALSLLAGLAAPLFAQPAENTLAADNPSETAPLTEEGDSITLGFSANTTYYSDVDFDDALGTIESWQTRLGITMITNLEGGRWAVGFDAEYTDYDFTTTGTPATFDDVTILTLTTSYTAQLDNGNTWFVGGSVNAATESGAAFDDSIAGTVFGGYRHKVNENLQLGLGLAIKTRLEDDVLILPLPQFKYNMGNGWTVENHRVGAKIMYAANDALSFGVIGEYESRSFRLDDTNAISGGAATETRVPIAFQVEYTPSKAVQLHGQIGASVGSSLEFFDTNGNTVSERDFDASVFFGFGGTIHF